LLQQLLPGTAIAGHIRQGMDHSNVEADQDDEGAEIAGALEALVRHVSQASLKEIAAIRAGVDKQLSAIEARLKTDSHRSAIEATVTVLGRLMEESIERAERQSETTVAQTLAMNANLRTALEKARQQFESARTQFIDVQTRLKRSEQERERLASEFGNLERRLKDMSAARATAEEKYQQLVFASQKLTEGFFQTIHHEREQVRTIPDVAPKRADVDNKVSALTPPSPGSASLGTSTPLKSAPPPPPASTSTGTPAPKKPLQFSERARDAKRVKIRAGIDAMVNDVPGELVDLSLGGAQVMLRNSVKPNQLVQLIVPTATGQLLCKARIVWAFFEQSHTSQSRYRSGMKFIDADTEAVQQFITDFCDESLIQWRSGIAGTAAKDAKKQRIR
jgi:PilZ domain